MNDSDKESATPEPMMEESAPAEALVTSNDGASEERPSELLITVKEHVLPWIVLMASCYHITIVDGNVMTFSVLVPSITGDLKVSNIQVLLISSVCNACYFGASPFASATIEKFSFRIASMLGALFCAVSLVLTYYSHNYYLVLLFYGILFGIGLSFLAVSSTVIIGFYFEHNRAIAFTLANTGSSLGIIIFEQLHIYLVGINGWRNNIILTSGFFGIAIFSSLVYLPIPPLVQISQTTARRVSILQTNPTEMGGPSLQQVRRIRAAAARYPASFSRYLKRTLYSMTDIHLLQRKSYVLICLSCFFVYSVFFVPILFVKERNAQAGINTKYEAWYVTTIGLAGIFGRFFFGFLAIKFDPLDLSLAVFLVSGLAVLASTLYFTFTYQVICSGVFGFCVVSTSNLRSLILLEHYGLNKLTMATGMILLFQGVAVLIGPLITGAIKNYSYLMCFLFGGIGFLIATTILWIAKIYLKIEHKKYFPPAKRSKAKTEVKNKTVMFNEDHKENTASE